MVGGKIFNKKMTDKKEIFDTEKHPAVLIQEFKEYISRKLAPSSVYAYVTVIKSYLLNGNKIDSVENYHKFLYEHTRKKRSTHYYDVIIKFINWIKIPRETKKEILTLIKDFGWNIINSSTDLLKISSVSCLCF